MPWFFDAASWGDLIELAKGKAVLFTVGGSLAALGTFWINREVGKRTMARLAIDQQSSSDHHILNLCKALSDSKQSLQLAAAALLVDRARTTNIRVDQGSERIAILQALLAATMDDKRTAERNLAPADLCKYVADSVVDILKARDTPQRKETPLKELYWQQTRLTNADWKDVDARGLDLFGANLDRASLRRASLRGAILYGSSLRSAVMCGADLREADFRGADLTGADFRPCDRTGKLIPTLLAGAKVQGADLTGAKLDKLDLAEIAYDGETKWPAGFSPAIAQRPVTAATFFPVQTAAKGANG